MRSSKKVLSNLFQLNNDSDYVLEHKSHRPIQPNMCLSQQKSILRKEVYASVHQPQIGKRPN